MKDKAEALLARMNRAQATGGKYMWYMLFTDAVADRLCETEVISREDMRAIFTKRLEEAKANGDPALFIAGYEECLTVLDELTSSQTERNGYKPTGL